MFALLLIFFILLGTSAILYALTILETPAPDYPTIPIWQTLYDHARGITRAESYNTRIRPIIERHGAVNLWHAGRWVVLATRPDLVAQIFRQDDIFIKGGNIKKIPHSTFARIFGVNIIDSHGALHTSFTEIIKPGIQRRFDLEPAKASSAQLAESLLREQAQHPAKGVGIDHGIMEWAVRVFADSFLDLDAERVQVYFPRVVEAMDRFKDGVATRLQTLLYNIFPSLERLHWLLPSGHYGVRIADRLEDLIMELAELTDEDHANATRSRDNEQVIHRLRKAYRAGSITKYHYRCNLKQLFIAGVENIDIVLNSALWELGKNVALQRRLRHEVLTKLPGNYTESDLDELPLLTATVYETLRLYPPLINLINRYTSEPVQFGSDTTHPLPKDTWVGWHSYGTHTDPCVWGTSAREFDPDRWGWDTVTIHNMFRGMQVKGKFFPFATHGRRCLASKFALTQMKLALCELLRRVEWERDEDYNLSLVTGVLLGPRNCKLFFRERVKKELNEPSLDC
ncbi:putative sporulation-specific N-formyltyrosine oxidase Dit2 [Aspergillus homomorphus CBS 101889]|uniref:Putative sporulation-specific N-formyltyrosine oxidase Dit2 n=1 Tax=Aspergillus homomorphus (strain CBS 101889) TaxID=1450537 RepID=A0A395I873_ASPHC|nr:putative sporulation-specific N-formyltyrosine oxidase Dit2 [Aspergillus homomorphus CBS 101889]RAL16166.1 putative sporulation-specific N-formyltyrosine oxidase Dit2 [Aspergillus homomorphus CBS 101889]